MSAKARGKRPVKETAEESRRGKLCHSATTTTTTRTVIHEQKKIKNCSYLNKRWLLLLAVSSFFYLNSISKQFNVGKLSTSLLLAEASSGLTDFDGATFYKAPVGSRVRIACNGSHWSEDAISLVLWFKGAATDATEGGRPIYTLDARHRSPSQGARHLVADQYKGRARFVTSARPPYLDLFPLEASDQAEYRCRIDYRTRPRENFLLILFVLVPPVSVQIMDSSGRSLEQIYGPLSEDSDLTLLCVSKGGRPAPAIRWKLAKQTLDQTYLTLADFRALERAKRLLDSTSSPEQQATNHSSLGAHATDWLADWRRWPEFEHFTSHMNTSSDSTYLSPATTSNRKWSPKTTGSREQSSSTNDWYWAGEQLLTLEVPEQITSSVNVLKLANLGQLARSSVDSDGLHESKTISKMPELECEASNLHYDLRSLIKLFAPGSLLVGRQWPEVGKQRPTVMSADYYEPLGAAPSLAHQAPASSSNPSTATRGQWASSERQLVAAIDQALEFALTSSSTVKESSSPSVATAQTVQIGQQQPPSTTATNTVQMLVEEQQTTQTLLMSRPRSEGIVADDKQELLVYQQLLERPHQLSDSLDLSGSSGFGQQGNAEQLKLVRSRLIALDIYLRPLDVRISSSAQGRPLASGQLAEFNCQSSGSRPPAKLSWWRQGEPLEPKHQLQVAHTDLVSTSKLTLRLDRLDHGKELTCRAQNEPLESLTGRSYTVQDSRLLSVQYAPRVKLELGNRMLSTQIREGTDIYFDCQVDAQPQVKEISWLHNEIPINATATTLNSNQNINNNINWQESSNIFVSNNSLVLQRVRVKQQGQYACVAFNSEGVTESNRIELRVLHAPSCSAQGAERAGYVLVESKRVALNSRVQFECPMEAEPANELEMSWYLNNSQTERRELSVWGFSRTERVKLGALSRFEFTPESGFDYGNLYCVARNSLGEQKRACVFEILPPIAPGLTDEQEGCLTMNVTSNSVGVTCGPSDRPIGVELWRAGKLEANLSHVEEGNFAVSNLRPSTQYILIIHYQGLDYSNGSSSASAAHPPIELPFSTSPADDPPPPSNGQLSALISTRSTQAAQLGGLDQWPTARESLSRQSLFTGTGRGVPGELAGPMNKVDENKAGQGVSGSLLGSMLTRLSWVLAGRRSSAHSVSSNKLMETPELLASLLCLLLIIAAGSLTILLFVRKFRLLKLNERSFLSCFRQAASLRVGPQSGCSSSSSSDPSPFKQPTSNANNNNGPTKAAVQEAFIQRDYLVNSGKGRGSECKERPARSQSVALSLHSLNPTATRTADHVGLFPTNQSIAWTMSSQEASRGEQSSLSEAELVHSQRTNSNFYINTKSRMNYSELSGVRTKAQRRQQQQSGLIHEQTGFRAATLERSVNLPAYPGEHPVAVSGVAAYQGHTFATTSSLSREQNANSKLSVAATATATAAPASKLSASSLDGSGLRVSKSRSALCLESLAKSQQQQPPTHLVEFSDTLASTRGRTKRCRDEPAPIINGVAESSSLYAALVSAQQQQDCVDYSFASKVNFQRPSDYSALVSTGKHPVESSVSSNIFWPLTSADTSGSITRSGLIKSSEPLTHSVQAVAASNHLLAGLGNCKPMQTQPQPSDSLSAFSLAAPAAGSLMTDQLGSQFVSQYKNDMMSNNLDLHSSNSLTLSDQSSADQAASTKHPKCSHIHDYSSEQLIELLHQSSANMNHESMLDMSLNFPNNDQPSTALSGNFLSNIEEQIGTSYNEQQQQRYHAANCRQHSNITLKCPSLNSSASIASSTLKDQSPLSFTNTTLSNTTNPIILYNSYTQEFEHQQHHHHHQFPDSHDSSNNGLGRHDLAAHFQLQQHNHQIIQSPFQSVSSNNSDNNCLATFTDAKDQEQSFILYAQNQTPLSNGLLRHPPSSVTSILKNSNSKSRFNSIQQQQEDQEQLHNVCRCNDKDISLNEAGKAEKEREEDK